MRGKVIGDCVILVFIDITAIIGRKDNSILIALPVSFSFFRIQPTLSSTALTMPAYVAFLSDVISEDNYF
ncbi:MAG: hypothetical protein R2757_18070 [Draconibacterium sp.]